MKYLFTTIIKEIKIKLFLINQIGNSMKTNNLSTVISLEKEVQLYVSVNW